MRHDDQQHHIPYLDQYLKVQQLLIGVAIVVIFILALPSLGTTFFNNMIDSVKNISSSQQTASPTELTDEVRRRYVHEVLAGFNEYYNNYYEMFGKKIPKDERNCGATGTSCNLSTYGKIRLGFNVTFSVVTTPQSGVTQNDNIPNATTENVALYKNARCNENGTIIYDATVNFTAAVIKLSDNTFYCAHN